MYQTLVVILRSARESSCSAKKGPPSAPMRSHNPQTTATRRHTPPRNTATTRANAHTPPRRALAPMIATSARATTPRAAGSFRRRHRSASSAGATQKPRSLTVVAAKGDVYEKTIPKPIELKFQRGNDGGAYVVFVPSDPKYDDFKVGDKIEAVSASFGDEIWGAESYGQVMYAIKNRNGDIYLKMTDMDGDISALEQNEKSSAFKNERAGGNYGAGTKEQQMNNYSKKRELENQRLDMFDEAIELYNSKDYDSALMIFEEVAALEPKNYMGDDFSKTTEIYRVAQYNIACCFSRLQKADESLLALKRCMAAGWTDYKKIRSDPSLAFVQKAAGFNELMDRFDEPIFNSNALEALGKLFKKPF